MGARDKGTQRVVPSRNSKQLANTGSCTLWASRVRPFPLIMAPTTDKIWIRDIAEICAAKGMRHAVISPGSRSAPLVIAFSRHPNIECLQVIDERTAAFFALGIAQQTGMPVALICTSGSAPLNYAPAIAEAYYQRVPLIVFTADRPDELIDQRDGQTIRQKNLYHNYIRKSFHLPVSAENDDDRWHCSRIISEAMNNTLFPAAGPVHVNVPLREPLYQLKDQRNYRPPKIIEHIPMITGLNETESRRLQQEWSSFKNKLILAGASSENGFARHMKKIADDRSVVILTESSSNLGLKEAIPCIDPVLEALPADKSFFRPELVVTIGGEIVSKKIKAFLRTNKPQEHWHVDISGDHVDTFKCLTRVIGLRTRDFLHVMGGAAKSRSNYHALWMKAYEQAKKTRSDVLKQSPFCDLTVFDVLLQSLPDGCNLHLGNSTPIRYANLFEVNPSIRVNCNRGTSGIDGTVSTAAGAAYVNKRLTVLITGDLGFFYDSNALWNRHLPNNLRIIIINNSGGNIFRIIPGPSSLHELEDFFETRQEQSAEHIAKAFSLPYYFCGDMPSLQRLLKSFFKPHVKAAILEIKTPSEVSARVLKEYMNLR